jgi:putative transcriptional regulator
MEDRFDPAKDAVNQIKHQLSLAFGDRIFEDDDHLILPARSTGRIDSRWSVWWGTSCLPAFSSGGTTCPVSFPCEGATQVKKEPIVLAADPADPEDFNVTLEALDRGQRARLIRKTRSGLGLSQAEFARRFRVPVGTLRDWEQARATAPDFAVAYVRVIGQYPDIVAQAAAS